MQLRGGGLERQESAGRYLAAERGWEVEHVFRTPHSAMTSEREDIDSDIAYILKRRKEGVNIHYYVVQSLDRVTRVGFSEYWYLKEKFEEIGVQFVDTTGIIQQKKNTLAHLGEQYKYPWSIYSSSEGAETAEALRSKDDVRSILTRLIGGEIQLVKEGYAVRRAPDGLQNDVIFVGAKKRVVREVSPRTGFFQKMFQLLADGMDYPEVCQRLNAMGFKTRIYKKWDRSDPEHPRVVGERGGKPLTVKQLQRYVMQTEYAGVSCEKWNRHSPVKMQDFDGIVSVEVFNKANRGKVYITPEIYSGAKPGGAVEVLFNHIAWGRVRRMRDNPRYPWKCILCPYCGSEMLASASKGKSGASFEGYHCGGAKTGKRAHKYFRVRRDDLERNVIQYLDSLRFQDGFMAGLELHLINEYRNREKEVLIQSSAISRTVADLKAELAQKLHAFGLAKSEVVRDQLEKQIEQLEADTKRAEGERGRIEINERSIRGFRKYAEHVMEHPSEILTNADNMHTRRALMSLFFTEIPNYQEILNRTPKLQPLFRLSETFKNDKSQLVSPLSLEWNTMENMVLRWNEVFSLINLPELEPNYA